MSRIHEYIDFIHIREKAWSKEQQVYTITGLIGQGVPREKIIINGSPQIAAKTGIGGVQIPSDSLDVCVVKQQYPELKIGCSIHSRKEAVRREGEGADFILYGHVFETDSKKGLSPRGLSNLQKVIQSVAIPVIAIGGITPSNTEQVFQRGAAGIAVLSGILLQEQPVEAVEQYIKAMRRRE